MKGNTVVTILALAALGGAVVVATISAIIPPTTSQSSQQNSNAVPLPTNSAQSSCIDTWPGYPIPNPTVLPGPNLLCDTIDSFGMALKSSCDASCSSSGGCALRTTGHTWDCLEAGNPSSRPEAVWLCPRSLWDQCDPRPPAPCEIDDMYCDTTCSGPKLVQSYWPNQPLNYFGLAAGEAASWSEGDQVRIGSDILTIKCISHGAPDGGDTNCGNDKATFDIVVADEDTTPTTTHQTGECVAHL